MGQPGMQPVGGAGGLLDEEAYARARQAQSMQGLWAGLLSATGRVRPSRAPRPALRRVRSGSCLCRCGHATSASSMPPAIAAARSDEPVEQPGASYCWKAAEPRRPSSSATAGFVLR
jgi:hypothetical protein